MNTSRPNAGSIKERRAKMSLEICSEGHGEVCYEGKGCPACDLQGDMQFRNLNTLNDYLQFVEEKSSVAI